MHKYQVLSRKFDLEFKFIPGGVIKYSTFYREDDKEVILEDVDPGVRAIHNILKFDGSDWRVIETAISGLRPWLVINETDRFELFWEYLILKLGNYGNSFEEGCLKCSFGLFDGALAVRSDTSLTKAADTIVNIAEKMGLYGTFDLSLLKFKPVVYEPSEIGGDSLPSVERVTQTVGPRM